MYLQLCLKYWCESAKNRIEKLGTEDEFDRPWRAVRWIEILLLIGFLIFPRFTKGRGEICSNGAPKGKKYPPTVPFSAARFIHDNPVFIVYKGNSCKHKKAQVNFTLFLYLNKIMHYEFTHQLILIKIWIHFYKTKQIHVNFARTHWRWGTLCRRMRRDASYNDSSPIWLTLYGYSKYFIAFVLINI